MISRAEDAAKHILANAKYSLPIDVHAVAKSLGVRVLSVALEDTVSRATCSKERLRNYRGE